MKFILCRASTWTNYPQKEVDINSLEDLKKIQDEAGGDDLIINFDENIIIICDNYDENETEADGEVEVQE